MVKAWDWCQCHYFMERLQINDDSSVCLQTASERLQRDTVEMCVVEFIAERATSTRYLDSSTVCHGFIGINGFIELLSFEEVGNQLLHLWDSGGPSHKDDFMHRTLVKLCVLHDFFLKKEIQRGSMVILLVYWPPCAPYPW